MNEAIDPTIDAVYRDIFSLLDAEYYSSKYPDVRAEGADPVVHYATVGWREGRDPSPWFSTCAYLELHPEVKAAGINPLQHYAKSGFVDGAAVCAPNEVVAPIPTLPMTTRAATLASSPGALVINAVRLDQLIRHTLRRSDKAKLLMSWPAGWPGSFPADVGDEDTIDLRQTGTSRDMVEVRSGRWSAGVFPRSLACRKFELFVRRLQPSERELMLVNAPLNAADTIHAVMKACAIRKIDLWPGPAPKSLAAADKKAWARLSRGGELTVHASAPQAAAWLKAGLQAAQLIELKPGRTARVRK